MIIGADLHQNPDVPLSPNFKALIDLARSTNDSAAILGDFIQGLPWGANSWRGAPCVQEIRDYVAGVNLCLIWGNHDPPDLLEMLFGDLENVTISRTIELSYRDTKIILSHGHEFGPLWSWLQYGAPWFTNLMARHFPSRWYRFTKRMGWIPSETKAEKRYHAVVRAVMSGALRYCTKNSCRYIHGHTHKKTCVKEQFSYGMDYVVMSLDPLDTGCYLMVQQDITWGMLP